jgi:hypothetical protein
LKATPSGGVYKIRQGREKSCTVSTSRDDFPLINPCYKEGRGSKELRLYKIMVSTFLDYTKDDAVVFMDNDLANHDVENLAVFKREQWRDMCLKWLRVRTTYMFYP